MKMDENETAEYFVANESLEDNCSLYGESVNRRSPLFAVTNILDSVIPPMLLLIGIPGNILTMIVILRRYGTLSSTAVYLLMLAISDTVFLLFGTFVDWLIAVFQYSFRDQNNTLCKLSNFLYYGSAQFSSWILVAITVERIICVTVPHRVKLLCTPKFSYICGTVICIFLICINTHFLFGYGIANTFFDHYGSKCGPLFIGNYQVFYFDIWPWVDFTLLFAMPFVALCCGNSIILIKLSRIYSAKSIQMENDKNKRSKQRRLRSVTLLIVGLNFTFLVCVTPLAIFLIIETSLYDWIESVACTDLSTYEFRQGLISLLWSVCICLSYINPSVNFILYVLSGEKFRNEIKALICCKPISAENAFA